MTAAKSLVPLAGDAVVHVDARDIPLTNLHKPFFPGLTKGDLLRYYEAVSPWLLPHLRDRPMVMKRYPHGWDGAFFFMKRAPAGRPSWIRTVPVDHGDEKGTIDFPIIDDLPSLLWVINLGCIDLNPWYARADDLDRPDYLHFDLDPVPGATFATVRETALVVRELLEALHMPVYVKTTGSRGLHVYVPIARGPTQREVWSFAKVFAAEVERRRPELATAVYQVKARPHGRVLVDYNQNRWGSTLASVYSVRPTADARVSTPITWRELADGALPEDFTLRTVPDRLRRRGDRWAPPSGGRRFDLSALLPSR